jgi:hypothetical protein
MSGFFHWMQTKSFLTRPEVKLSKNGERVAMKNMMVTILSGIPFISVDGLIMGVGIQITSYDCSGRPKVNGVAVTRMTA